MAVRVVDQDGRKVRTCETDLREAFFHPYLFLSCGAHHVRHQPYHSRRQ